MSAQLQPQGQPQASTTEGLGLLDDIVARSKVAKTDVEHARAKDIIGELVREVLDGTVVVSDNLSASIDARIFLRQRYALFCGQHHPLFGRDDLRIADITSYPLVSFNSDRVGGHLSPLAIFRDEMGFTGRVIGSSSSMTEIKRLIYAGFGIGCLPEHTVYDDVRSGRFQRLPPDQGVSHRSRCLEALALC